MTRTKLMGLIILSLVILAFTGQATAIRASSCTRAEAASSVVMNVASIKTTTSDRFIVADPAQQVELIHEIIIDASYGEASASMDVQVQESRNTDNAPAVLHEQMIIRDSTRVSGVIRSFSKSMRYQSGLTR